MQSRYLLGAVSLAAFIAIAPTSVGADHVAPLARFTFAEPVSVPGATLPPGEYVFQFLDAVSNREVVQVVDFQRRQVHGLFRTRRIERPTPSANTEVAFGEGPRGMARSIRALWFAGSTEGRELIYARNEASWQGATAVRADGD